MHRLKEDAKTIELSREKVAKLGLYVQIDNNFTFKFMSYDHLFNMLKFFENYPKNRRCSMQHKLPIYLFKAKTREKVITKLREAETLARNTATNLPKRMHAVIEQATSGYQVPGCVVTL